jgi:hypothetical protein
MSATSALLRTFLTISTVVLVYCAYEKEVVQAGLGSTHTFWLQALPSIIYTTIGIAYGWVIDKRPHLHERTAVLGHLAHLSTVGVMLLCELHPDSNTKQSLWVAAFVQPIGVMMMTTELSWTMNLLPSRQRHAWRQLTMVAFALGVVYMSFVSYIIVDSSISSAFYIGAACDIVLLSFVTMDMMKAWARDDFQASTQQISIELQQASGDYRANASITRTLNSMRVWDKPEFWLILNICILGGATAYDTSILAFLGTHFSELEHGSSVGYISSTTVVIIFILGLSLYNVNKNRTTVERHLYAGRARSFGLNGCRSSEFFPQLRFCLFSGILFFTSAELLLER